MESLLHLARHTFAGLRVLIVLTVLLGLAYPLAVTGVAQGAFDWRASGSLVTSSGEHTTSYDDAVGSALIGQRFDGPEWFHSRPSAGGWDPLATGGSNLGPTSPDLLATIENRRAAIAEEEGVDPRLVPPDALTASASGLDPHISPAWADLQVARVARERGLADDVVRRLVDEHTHGRDLGVLGAPRVDVLAVNLALVGLED